MATSPQEQSPASENAGADGDKAVEDHFPASVAPATGGPARIESEDGEQADEDAPE